MPRIITIEPRTSKFVENKRRPSIKVVKQRVVGEAVLPPEEDLLAIEDPLEISLVYDQSGESIEKVLTLTMRTPGNDSEMITGFLYGEGIIQQASDIESIRFEDPVGEEPPTRAKVTLQPEIKFKPNDFERHFAVNSSCGVCGKTSLGKLALPESLKFDDKVEIKASLIHELPSLMNAAQPTFQKTGGLHAASLFTSEGKLLGSREDIGRHNALDKVVGMQLLDKSMAQDDNILCVSGRMSYEILQKAIMARIRIIAGVGAPSSLAVTLANDFHVTLLGFVRQGSYNIYSQPERIINAPALA
ncbi:formate dehydrogenase accessory sulfurtransferase FdhD [Rubellicoccus peritrichatus]|uniref:Sulfur carrier protein FdhD n=1 Tax=Rubellicoccus peritrichatus TaxID=3080537 RepID=A0AAQ3QVD2_9BACT|nr:formate dehydrogenase accessory sulfurtransferase FdhD [Puniceicoccus sp. CR14]WOO40755.1 formate dehydrogenase accessory sulfurtransferase FdhD [Puniceicoccus sp. CR14]